MSYAVFAHDLGKRYRANAGSNDVGTLPMRKKLDAIARAPARLLRLRDGRDAGPAAETWALRHASFQLDYGEALALVGHNGAGKSVLLKMLARVTRPTEGHARIRGSVGALLEVGAGFHGELTGRENVYVTGAILGMRKGDVAARFDEIVGFADVGSYLDTPVKRYSNGMRVRLAFAVAAHLECEVLLVDEALAVCDDRFRERSIEKMRAIVDEGRSLVFVSHDLEIARRVCRRALLLDEGRLVADGATDDLVERYQQAMRSVD